ncbi:MAG TPA: hypothetical protein IAA07_00275 [Candidatus Lachnoclostridium stercoravium]|uniref:Uncharacterized protein n=1 Tax=Candidatus Lachnoclostridium stercoravium TaxID=2838633 RepID=A0A9D2KMD0_9FIRM|nr:hypothetical protein [Candidatus Lachnoclostridium stercoravium]
MINKEKSKELMEKSIKEINSRATSRRQSQRNAAHIFQMKEYINRLIPFVHEEEGKEILVKILEEAAKL